MATVKVRFLATVTFVIVARISLEVSIFCQRVDLVNLSV